MYEAYPVVLATAAFIYDSTNKSILIIKKSIHEQIDAGLWTVPGGKVRPDEPIIDSLKREAHEEVGLEIISYRWIGEDVFVSNKTYFHAQHFVCSVKKTSPVILEAKMKEYAWVTRDAVSRYEFPHNIKNRILKIFRNENP